MCGGDQVDKRADNQNSPREFLLNQFVEQQRKGSSPAAQHKKALKKTKASQAMMILSTIAKIVFAETLKDQDLSKEITHIQTHDLLFADNDKQNQFNLGMQLSAGGVSPARLLTPLATDFAFNEFIQSKHEDEFKHSSEDDQNEMMQAAELSENDHSLSETTLSETPEKKEFIQRQVNKQQQAHSREQAQAQSHSSHQYSSSSTSQNVSARFEDAIKMGSMQILFISLDGSPILSPPPHDFFLADNSVFVSDYLAELSDELSEVVLSVEGVDVSYEYAEGDGYTFGEHATSQLEHTFNEQYIPVTDANIDNTLQNNTGESTESSTQEGGDSIINDIIDGGGSEYTETGAGTGTGVGVGEGTSGGSGGGSSSNPNSEFSNTSTTDDTSGGSGTTSSSPSQVLTSLFVNGGATIANGGAGSSDILTLLNTTGSSYTVTIQDGATAGMGDSSVIVITFDDGNTSNQVTVDGFEDIVFQGGSGGDTLVISGDFSNTDLLPNTITFEGSDANDNIDASGITSNHHVVANLGDGDDTFRGGAASDEVNTGSGNDIIYFDGTDTLSIDGGDGDDTLRVIGDIDITTASNLKNFETVDLQNDAGNTVVFNETSAISMVGSTNTLRIINATSNAVKTSDNWLFKENYYDEGQLQPFFQLINTGSSGSLTLELEPGIEHDDFVQAAIPTNISTANNIWGVANSNLNITIPNAESFTDFSIRVGDKDLRQDQGLLFAQSKSVDPYLDPNTGDVFFPTSTVYSDNGILKIDTQSAGAAGTGELATDLSAIFFPFQAGWVGGHVAEDGTLVAGYGIDQSNILYLDDGKFSITIDGTENPASNGVLYAIGGDNQDTIVSTLNDGNQWEIKTAKIADGGLTDRPFSFVYIPVNVPIHTGTQSESSPGDTNGDGIPDNFVTDGNFVNESVNKGIVSGKIFTGTITANSPLIANTYTAEKYFNSTFSTDTGNIVLKFYTDDTQTTQYSGSDGMLLLTPDTYNTTFNHDNIVIYDEVDVDNDGITEFVVNTLNPFDVFNGYYQDVNFVFTFIPFDSLLDPPAIGGNSNGYYVSDQLGEDNLYIGTSANDNLHGGDGNDRIFSYGGNDTISGGDGTDILSGGLGDDVYIVLDSNDAANDTFIENVGGGTDTIQSSVSFSLLTVNNIENITLSGSNNASATGNNENNVLIGDSSNNTITGNGGDDTIDAGDGDDTVIYDPLDSSVDGGLGTDTILVDTNSTTLDNGPLTAYSNVEILESSGDNNTISLSSTDTINATDNNNQLYIKNTGNNNAFTFADGADNWAQSTTVTYDSDTYRTFTNNGATIYLENDFNLSGFTYNVGFTTTSSSSNESDAETITLTVSLNTSNQTGSDITVGYQFTSSDNQLDYADATVDFVGADTLTFANGETSKTITFQINDDFLFESNETIEVSLSNTSAGVLINANSQHRHTITDDEGTVTGPFTDFAQNDIVENSITGAGLQPAGNHFIDIDGDGDLDIISAAETGDAVYLFENDGTLTPDFANNRITIKSGVEVDGARKVSSADLDGDGDLDILATSGTLNSILWWKNNGDGSFDSTTNTITNALTNVWDVKTADLDGDGDIDVIGSRDADPGNIFWYENDGAGGTWTEHQLNTNTVNFAKEIEVGDFNGDGYIDVAAVSAQSAVSTRINVFSNDGNGNFTSTYSDNTPARAASITAADLNGDGYLDFVSGGAYNLSVAGLRYYTNNQAGSFSTTIIDASWKPVRIATGDVDGDGDLDLFSASDSNTLAWFENTNGSGTAWTKHDITLSGQTVADIAIVDINNDGINELVMGDADAANSSITWWQPTKVLFSNTDDSINLTAVTDAIFQLAGTTSQYGLSSYNAGDGNDNITLPDIGSGPASYNEAQTFLAGAGNDTITGGSRDDIINGGEGNDNLNGGTGTDTLIGGLGDDTFTIDSTADTVSENNSEGNDTVNLGGAAVNYDFTATNNITGIDILSIGNLNHTVTLNDAAVAAMTDTNDDTLRINGSSGSVTFADASNWSYVTAFNDTGVTYSRYLSASGDTVEIAKVIDQTSATSTTAYTIDADQTEFDGNNGLYISGPTTGGTVEGDTFAWGMSYVGDFNGDGFTDIIFTDLNADVSSNTNSGAVYLVFGDTLTGTDGSIDLQANPLDGSNGVVFFSTKDGNENDALVFGNGGDFNGDGLSDIFITSSAGDYEFIVYGTTQANPFSGATFDLANLTSSQGITMSLNPVADNGDRPNGLGDINGDGYDDFTLTEHAYNSSTGRTHIIFGGPNSDFNGSIDLSQITLGNGGFVLDGGAAGDSLGSPARQVADFDGDGINDIILGASGTDNGGGSNDGSIYVIFGQTDYTGLSTLDVETLSLSSGTVRGFRIDGSDNYSLSSGFSVDDINGDGYADIIASTFSPAEQTGYVFYGGTRGNFSDVMDAEADYDVKIDLFVNGPSGDFNGDGINDIMATDIYASAGRGEIYIIYGGTSLANINSANDITPSVGFVVDTDVDTLHANRNRLDGDLNGDGFDDLILGNPAGNGGYGDAHIIFGFDSNGSVDLLGESGNDTLTAFANGNGIVAGTGDDTLNNSTFTGVSMKGGAGNDTMTLNDVTADNTITSADFVAVYGGSGTDTLQLGSGDSLDLTNDLLQIFDMEVVELQGGTLTLDKASVLNLSSTSNTITVNGGSGSHLIINGSNWNLSGLSTTQVTYSDAQTVIKFSSALSSITIDGDKYRYYTDGAGDDTFTITAGTGINVITNFEATNDNEKIDLSNYGNNLTLSAVLTQADVTDADGDLNIDDIEIYLESLNGGTAGDSLILFNTSIDDLDLNDFIFNAANDYFTNDADSIRYSFVPNAEFTTQQGSALGTYNSGAGNDFIYLPDVGDGPVGYDETNTFNAGSGNDTIIGGTRNDIIYGGAGTDFLQGNDGADILDGGADADTLLGDNGADQFTWSDLTDSTTTNTDTVNDFTLGTDFIVFTDTNVTIYVDPDDDGNNDEFTGVAGEIRWLDDGSNNALIEVDTNGDTSADFRARLQTINFALISFANMRFSRVIGSENADTLNGTDGDDVIEGAGGNDVLDGGLGTDTVSFSSSSNDITVNLDAGTATGEGTDTISNFENVTGGSGDDTFYGTTSNNTFTGGSGTDTVNFSNAASAITANLSTSTATGAGTDSFSSIENLIGSDGNDILTGDGNNNYIDGGAGNDTLSGEGGNDTIVGSSGGDSIAGGAGDDVIYADGETFNPISIGNLALWLDATDVDGLGGSTNGTTIGDSVWTDKSGNNVTISSNDDVDPTLTYGEAANLNGRASVVFDGDDTALVTSAMSNSAQNTIITLFAFDVLPAPGPDNRQYIYDSHAAGERLYHLYDDTDFAYAGTEVALGQAASTNFEVHTDIFNSTESEFYKDGSLIASPNPGTNTLTQLTLGDLNNNNADDRYNFAGSMAEVFVFSDVLTTQERGSVEEYLAFKYGLTSLGYDFSADTLTGGGGNDTFVWNDNSISNSANRDSITDFKDSGDSDKVKLLFDQALTIVGNTGTHSAVAGNMIWYNNSGDTIVSVDWNGDGTGDFEIELTGVTDSTITTNDFIFHHVTGSSNNDTLTGSELDDYIGGGDGDDTLDAGSAGTDTSVFEGDITDYIFGLDDTGTTLTVTDNVNNGGTDTATNFDQFEFNGTTYTLTFGTSGADSLSANAGEFVFGLEGNDTITGHEGVDVISGGAGNDTLIGGYGGDNLSGGAGDDVIYADDEYLDLLSVGTISLWLDASDESTITKDGSNFVSQWDDKDTADAQNVTQGSATNQPTYTYNSINGRATIDFDGIDNYLALTGVAGSSLASTDEITTFVVQHNDTEAVSTTFFWENASGDRINLHAAWSDNNIYWDFGNVGAGGRISEAMPTGFRDDFKIVSTTRNTDNTGEILVDGSSLLSDSMTDTLDTSASATLHIGNVAALDAPFPGKISEILFFKNSLSASDYAKVESYLSYKYGITLDGQTFGIDTLTGGTGADTFVWTNSSISTTTNQDVITDFNSGEGDKIKLLFDDILTLTGDTGSARTFNTTAGEMIWWDDQSDSFVEINWGTDSTADFSIKLEGIADASVLTSADFIFHNVIGSSANETLTGSELADNISGGNGNDIISGGAGADTLDGGANIDTLSYSSDSTGVTINLSTNSASGGDAQSDVISNFENVIGGSAADSLTGDNNNNFIIGGDGNDSLTGGAGADTFTFYKANGQDTITDFTVDSDQIDLADYATTFATLQGVISQNGAHTEIDVGSLAGGTAGDKITLNNVTAANLDANDFILSRTVQFSTTSASGSEGVRYINATVELSAAFYSDVTVNYAVTTNGGGSHADNYGIDYLLSPTGQVTIEAGQTSADLTFQVNDDLLLNESDELVEVTLSSPTNATLGVNTTHTYTIQDNDNQSVSETIKDSFTANQIDTGYLGLQIATGDFNGDGNTDFTISQGDAAGTIRFYLHQGEAQNPTFASSSVTAASQNGGVDVDTSDIDSDGDLDVVLNYFSNATDEIHWFENDGNGSFSSEQVIATGLNDPQLLVADFADINNDGYADIVAGSTASNEVVWYANDGTGNFGTKNVIDNNSGDTTATGGRAMTVADLDNDGDQDVAHTSDNSGIYVDINDNGDGSSFTQIQVDSAFAVFTDIMAADLDGDGDYDLVAATPTANELNWYENDNGDATSWTKHSIASTEISYEFADIGVGDADLDGDLDLLLSERDLQDADAGQLRMFENTSGDGSTWEEHVIDNDISANSAEFANIDSDAEPEIVVASYSDTASWYDII